MREISENKFLIIDNRMRKIEKENLKNLGYNLIEVKPNVQVYPEISSHVDIFICQIGKKLIIEPSQYNQIKKQLQEIEKIDKGIEKLGENYPQDIKYNVCIIGKKALHNFKYTEPKIIEELEEQGYELINTNQGYTNCSIAVIDDNSAIVTDKGLYKILKKHEIDVLFLNYEPDIKLLNCKNEYSNKKGFIGGCISKIKNNIIIFGDLRKIDYNNQIKEFIEKKNLNIIDFKGLEVIDYGGIANID